MGWRDLGFLSLPPKEGHTVVPYRGVPCYKMPLKTENRSPYTVNLLGLSYWTSAYQTVRNKIKLPSLNIWFQ